jgi:hypothetical protein
VKEGDEWPRNWQRRGFAKGVGSGEKDLAVERWGFNLPFAEKKSIFPLIEKSSKRTSTQEK